RPIERLRVYDVNYDVSLLAANRVYKSYKTERNSPSGVTLLSTDSGLCFRIREMKAMAAVAEHALLMCLIFSLTSPATATVSETEFNADKSPSSGPTNSVSAAESVAARSDIECSTLCSAAQSSPGSGCKSWSFASATGHCFLSSNRTFGFEFASSIGASVYRGQE
uniref:Apple domain-containing protein n=1 Tax=Macrostomum lignano TaxID=282301 RepID=A0A1I8IZJ9_9PLAT